MSYIEARLRDERVFLAKNGDNPLGFLIYDIWWGNCPFIELIKVKADDQRSGIGKSLLNEAITEIKAQSFKNLISSSEVINDMGLNFHKSFGFRDLGILDLPHGKEKFFKINLEAMEATA